MRTQFALAATLSLVPAALLAQDAGLNPRLRVAFVGDLSSDRGKAFEAFLEQQFGAVDLVERAECEPSQLQTADVVLLDWGQNDDGIMTWFKDRNAPRRNPLGARTDWTKPTVLLGSAGLNVAASWGVKGNYG